MKSFERINEEKLPARKYFFSSTKERKTGGDGKILDGYINDEEYLTCKKTMGDYHDHYLKKDVSLLADVYKKFIDT